MKRLAILAVLLAVALPAAAQTHQKLDPNGNMVFYLTVSASDGNGLVGATPVVMLAKNGAAPAVARSSFTSIGRGYYASTTLDPNDYNTPGVLNGEANVVGYPLARFVTFVGYGDANIYDMQVRQGTLATAAQVTDTDANLRVATTSTDANLAYMINLQLTRMGTPLVSVLGDLLGNFGLHDANMKATVIQQVTRLDANMRVAVTSTDGNLALVAKAVATANDANGIERLALLLAQLTLHDANMRGRLAAMEANELVQIRLKDANLTYIQATVAGIDANTIAGAVWNMAIAQHLAAGSTGFTLNALTSSTGSGVNTVWPKAVDANGVAIQGATITAKYGVTTINNTTDANGIGQSMGLDTATYAWAVSKAGYSFTPASRAVPGDANFYMTQVAVAAATLAGACNVALDVYGADGNHIGSGVVVTFTQSTTPGGGAYGGPSTTATTNASGRATATLFRACDYYITVGSSGSKKITVPAAATYVVPAPGFIWKP